LSFLGDFPGVFRKHKEIAIIFFPTSLNFFWRTLYTDVRPRRETFSQNGLNNLSLPQITALLHSILHRVTTRDLRKLCQQARLFDRDKGIAIIFLPTSLQVFSAKPAARAPN
jgi:hypothetical protein